MPRRSLDLAASLLAAGEEQLAGRITVLTADPLTVPAVGFADLPARLTVVDGRPTPGPTRSPDRPRLNTPR